MTLNTSLQAYMAEVCLKFLIPDESRQSDAPPCFVVALYAMIQKEKAEANMQNCKVRVYFSMFKSLT